MLDSLLCICVIKYVSFHVIAAQNQCIDITGLIYSGTISVTRQNIDCQRWDSQNPHEHGYTDPSLFPDATLADAANFCRKPDGNDFPWCYTTSAEQHWDYCDFEAIYSGMIWGILFLLIFSLEVGVGIGFRRVSDGH